MKLTKFRTKPYIDGYMLIVTAQEAYSIIKSLSSQLLSQSMSEGRTEFYTSDNEYFSIAVEPLPEITK